MKLQSLPLDKLDLPGLEVREDVSMEGIEELAGSLKEVGLIHPLRVRRKRSRFEIVSGVRRYLAAKQLGWVSVPCLLEDGQGVDQEPIKVHENVFREDVNPLHLAAYLAKIKERDGLTQEALGVRFKRSGAWVNVMLGLLRLPENVKNLLEAGKCDYMSARELGQVEDVVTRNQMCEWIAKGGASRNTIKGWVERWKGEQEHRRVVSGPVPTREEAVHPVMELFRCKLCDQMKPQTDMLLVRVDSLCYTTLERAIRVMKETERADAGPGEAPGPGLPGPGPSQPESEGGPPGPPTEGGGPGAELPGGGDRP